MTRFRAGARAAVPEPESLREHRRRLGDVAPLTDLDVPVDRLLPPPLGHVLLLARRVGEQPGAVVESRTA
jgi:hypothetical protein